MITKKQIAKINEVNERVSGVISGDAQGSRIAAGLANEGFNGGYRTALNDVLLFLTSGCLPNTNRWWAERKEEE